MEFHTTLACRVVRMVEAADRSLRLGGEEIELENICEGDVLGAQGGLALA
jgi:hypothetical protein